MSQQKRLTIDFEMISKIADVKWSLGEGRDGKVWALEEEDEILKITRSEAEAIVATTLMRAADQRKTHPSVPIIHDVKIIRNGPRGIPHYLIFREAFEDIEFEKKRYADLWEATLDAFESAWKHDDVKKTRSVKRGWRYYGRHLDEMHRGLKWMKKHFGFKLGDLRPCNIGVSTVGIVGLRDLGIADGIEAYRSVLNDLEIIDTRVLKETAFAKS